ncbi:uncharacterized protein LOC119980747 [Tripterygium wilfordii]|uniref:uncharacterized protein LOC119980747 n=1 Tax=Tripterygium wilfordii TaxID=458696 RepID=UPI0018F8628B|nr:uncharacterized protein LOC119980747 [Tripterygium wilfordii]
MIISSWNIRGLNSPLKQHKAVCFMKRNKVDAMCFLETKFNCSKLSFTHRLRLRDWKFLDNTNVAANGRVVVFWNPSKVTTEYIDSSAQALHVKLTDLVDQKSFLATFVYWFNTITTRRSLWDDLKRWCPSDSWILSDLNYFGCYYSWSNGKIWCKLDRVLVNPASCSLLLPCNVQFLNVGAHFDHSPVKILIGTLLSRGNRAFKFFNMWTEHDQFLEVVNSHWHQSMHGSPMFRLCKRLKRLKGPLRDLNMKHFSHISERVDTAAAALDYHQSLLHHDLDNLHYIGKEGELRTTLLNLQSAERKFFSPKLKL